MKQGGQREVKLDLESTRQQQQNGPTLICVLKPSSRSGNQQVPSSDWALVQEVLRQRARQNASTPAR